MEKIVMSVEELAEILKQVRELPDGVIGDEYCSVCREMHDKCPVSSDKDCPHDEIVEYRYFVRQHYKRFIEREFDSYLNRPVSEFDKAVASAVLRIGSNMMDAMKDLGLVCVERK